MGDVVTKDECDTHRCSLRREVESLISENRATVLYEFSEIMDSKMNNLEKKVTASITAQNVSQTALLNEINARTVSLTERVHSEQDRTSLIQKFVIVILIGVIIGRGMDFILALMG